MLRPHAALAAVATIAASFCIYSASSVAASPGPGLESAASLPAASWSPHGAQADAKFGSSVAPAGDVNGDGFGDVLVGAPQFGNGQANEGQARLYYGSATGLSDVAGWTWESNQVGALGGACVAPAGDVNFDGYQDFLVGAPSWDEPGLPNTGAVFVFYGSATGPPAVANVKLLNFIIESTFGTSAGTAGDVNGDMYADVVVGAPLYSNGPFNQGACFVFHGSPAGLSTTPARTLEGGLAGAHFGASVSTAGDANGDGFADIVVGAPTWTEAPFVEQGKAFAFAGSVSGIGASSVWTAKAARDSSHYGASVANAGDVNGDGYADVLIGNPGADLTLSGTPKGAADLYLGKAAFFNVAPNVSFGGSSARERFGIAVATAGDLNGDGYADFAIGGDRWSGSGEQRGHVAVYTGGKSSNAYLADLFGNVNGDAFGAAVATSGDVNGDGFSELVVGDPEASPALAREGRARLFLGRASDPVIPAGWPRTGSGVGTSYGESVAILPHIDGGDWAMVAIGERTFSGAVNLSGRFTVHSGQWGGVSSTVAYTREGIAAGDQIAERMANAGDVDHDSNTDLIVSSIAYQTDGTQVDEGRVWLYRGSSTGPQLSSWSAEGNQAGAQFGSAIAGAGDVNGDGYADVLIGAPVWDSATLIDCGKAVLYLGGPAGLGVVPSWTREGTVAGQGFGYAVAMAGDLDGDGYSDIAVGSQPYGNLPLGFSSKVDVFFGSPAGLPANPQWTFLGSTVTYGTCVAGIGDFSGDGVSDLAIGAPEDNGFGRVFIHLGSRARAFPAVPRWQVAGNQTSAHFGFAIAGGGDVNGDGFADLVVAEPAFSNGQNREGRLHLFFGGTTSATLAPAWQYESNLAEDQMGNSLAPLADLDGDGFADIVAGSASQAGRAYIQLGGGIGALRRFTQSEPFAQAVQRWAPDLVNSPDQIGINHTFRSAAGRDRVDAEMEIRPQTSPFVNIPTHFQFNIDTQAPTSFGSIVTGGAPQAGMTVDTGYHWQARTVTRSPYFPRSRWFTTDAKHTGDLDFRTTGTNVGISPTVSVGGVPRLTRIAPNPSAAESQIAFWLPAPGRATIDVFDTRGRHVRRVAAGEWTGGLTVRPWDGKDSGGKSVAAGVYYVELRSGTLVDRAKLVRVR